MDLICDQVENISYGKDLTKRLPLPKVRDELYELSHKFNQMFERLEESFEKEQQFTADVSHELRTPVTVIISQFTGGSLREKSIRPMSVHMRKRKKKRS